MKVFELIEGRELSKAGCIPYCYDRDHEPRMAFMISSDARYGGPYPMIAKGGVDDSESLEQAGVREAEEELGLKRSNIVDGTLELGWSGELRGYDATYKFEVYMCQIDDLADFNKPHYETKEVVWLTEAEFNRKGRKTQHHIVTAIAEKARNKQ